jgi:hypothetical protein
MQVSLERWLKVLEADHPITKHYHRRGASHFCELHRACLYCGLWHIPANKEMVSADSSAQVGHEAADHIFIVSAADT